MKKRIEYIDLIETVAIFLVLCCHYIALQGESVFTNVTQQFFTTVAVPLFFMCNGALLLTTRLDVVKHIKKIFLLYISVVLWKAINLVGISFTNYETYKTISKVEIFNYLTGANIVDPYVPSGHFWFMYALIGIYILFPMLKITYDNCQSVIKLLVIFLFITTFIFAEYNALIHILVNRGAITNNYTLDSFIGSFYPFAQCGNYLLFFIIGAFLHSHYYKTNRTICRTTLIIVAATAFCLLIIEKYFQESTLGGPWIRLESDYQRIGTLVLSVCIYILCTSIDLDNCQTINRVCSFISVRSMNIYAIHMLLLAYFDIYCLPFITVRGTFIFLIKNILILLVAIIVTEPLTYIPGIRIILGLKPIHSNHSRN